MTTAAAHETEIAADPALPLVRITREFDAPPAAVFRAHTDPALLVQWLGPHGYEMLVDHYDCRSGGSYRYVHTGPDGEWAFRGCFHDVCPDETIVQTFTFEGAPGVALERMAFEGLDGGTRTRLVATSLAESFEGRDAFLASGMDAGVRDGYERLDALLAQTSGRAG